MKISKVRKILPHPFSAQPGAAVHSTRDCDVPEVLICSEHRNALYALFLGSLGEFLDLEAATKSDDLETCYRLGRRLHDGLRLIVDGGLGWGLRATSEPVRLELPAPELRRILLALRQEAVELRENLPPGSHEIQREVDRAALAEAGCDEALGQLHS
jgi:hypothetical protein